MHTRWWYGVAATSLAWGFYLFLGRSTGLESLLSTPTVGTGLRALLFVMWFSLPILVALDWRTIQGDAAWNPSIGPWLLISVIWLANVAAGAAYCLRRESALRGDVPSGQWMYGVVAGVVLWGAIVLSNLVESVVSTGVLGAVLSGPLVLVALAGYPTALYLDMEHVRGYTDWAPSVRFWVVGAIVPVINILAGFVYLFRRRVEYDQARSPETVELTGVRADPTPSVDSPWFRRVALGCLAYFLSFVIVGGTPGLVALDLPTLAVLLWVPFGLAITPMLHLDVDVLASYGFEWGPTRYLYLSTVALPPVAFLYLLRRSTAGRRALTVRDRASTAAKEAESSPDDGSEPTT